MHISQKLTRTVEYTEMAKNQMSEMKTITSETIEQQIRHCKKKKKAKLGNTKSRTVVSKRKLMPK